MKDFIKAFVAAQKEMKTALKDSPNPFFKSKYADLASIDEACKKALNDCDIAVTQLLDYDGERDFLITELLHISGEKLTSRCRLINGKGDSQGYGSTVSYMRRYSLAAICGVVTEDDDGHNSKKENLNSTKETKPIATPSQRDQITVLLESLRNLKEISPQDFEDGCMKITGKISSELWTSDDAEKIISHTKESIKKSKLKGESK